MFTAALFTTEIKMITTHMSIDRSTDEQNVVYQAWGIIKLSKGREI